MNRIPVEEYARIIRDLLASLGERPAELSPIAMAAGRVTAEEVRSPIDLPTFRNSQMDGFAVRAADVSDAPVTLPLAGEIAAGAIDPEPLRPGTAVAIMTGAPVPSGADAVVRVEDTRRVGGGIEIQRGRAIGEFVRRPGPTCPAARRCFRPGDASPRATWPRSRRRTSAKWPCARACASQ